MAKLILDAAYFIHFKHLLYFIDCSLQTEYIGFFFIGINEFGQIRQKTAEHFDVINHLFTYSLNHANMYFSTILIVNFNSLFWYVKSIIKCYLFCLAFIYASVFVILYTDVC